MGDIKRKRNKFTKPKKLFERSRIDEENILVKKYGLKNKKEIWKAKSLVSRFRKRAKELISSDTEEQQKFFEKLNKLGLNIVSLADILGLEEKDVLERRLQTYISKKGLANTVKQARQLIVHKHVLVDGVIVNIPSFWVTQELENKISLVEQKPKKAIAVENKNENGEEE